MSTEPLLLTIPDSLARELDSVGECLLVDLLQRGLREFKIEQALNRYGGEGSLSARQHAMPVYHAPSSPVTPMRAEWNLPSVPRRWQKR